MLLACRRHARRSPRALHAGVSASWPALHAAPPGPASGGGVLSGSGDGFGVSPTCGGGNSETFPTRPPEPAFFRQLGTEASWEGQGQVCGQNTGVHSGFWFRFRRPHQGLAFPGWSQNGRES